MQLRSVKGFTAVIGLALGTVANLCSALTADTTVANQSGALEEIAVIARRQNEDMEKPPVAVDALSISALAEQHVTTERELQMAVPDLLTVAGEYGVGVSRNFDQSTTPQSRGRGNWCCCTKSRAAP